MRIFRRIAGKLLSCELMSHSDMSLQALSTNINQNTIVSPKLVISNQDASSGGGGVGMAASVSAFFQSSTFFCNSATLNAGDHAMYSYYSYIIFPKGVLYSCLDRSPLVSSCSFSSFLHPAQPSSSLAIGSSIQLDMKAVLFIAPTVFFE